MTIKTTKIADHQTKRSKLSWQNYRYRRTAASFLSPVADCTVDPSDGIDRLRRQQTEYFISLPKMKGGGGGRSGSTVHRA